MYLGEWAYAKRHHQSFRAKDVGDENDRTYGGRITLRWGVLEILIVFFMFVVLPLLSLAPETQNLGPLELFRKMHQTFFPFPYSATIVCVGAWAIHIIEGYSASVFAKSLGLKEKQCSSWFWWTCTLGFPCLRWLVCLR